MSKQGSAAKVKLNSFDDLFGSAESASGEQIIHAKLEDLHTFKGHPFRVLDDEKMEETAESIGRYGVLVPGIVRPRACGGYEIIAGHRRKRGSEKAGLDTMPVIVRNYTDDEAAIIMVDSNIQREDILPSEKAKAYAGVSVYRRITENNDIITDFWTDNLLELILRKDNLNKAYKKVKSNKGKGGTDGMQVDELLPYLKENQSEIIQKIRERSFLTFCFPIMKAIWKSSGQRDAGM